MGNSERFGINARALVRAIFSETFTYSTVRSANINNKLVAIIYRLVQLCILAYIIGYDIIWNKGYQETDRATSTVTSKVKGLGFIGKNGTNLSNIMENDFISKSVRIFDTPDYIIPPNEYNSLFIMTNFIETNQTQSICDESLKKKSAICKQDSDCQKKSGSSLNTWNGIPTGKCLPSKKNNSINICQIIGWCPVEEDPVSEDENVIQNTLTYTIFIKNDVDFRKFNRKERNILPWITNSYIASCNYNKKKDPYCPVFLLDDILQIAEPDPNERRLMLRKGGVVLVEISWDCNYDFASAPCLPSYSFKRFDVKFSGNSSSSGFNFRFSNKYYVNEREYRSLYKAYGIRIIVSVSGTAGKFSILPFMLTIGAGLGLMGLSVIVADCVLLNFTEKKKLFQRLKELDAAEAIQNPNILKSSELSVLV